MSAPGGRAPVRGAQTFVGLMGVVWKRRDLTAIEVAWRWVVCGPLVFLATKVFLARIAPHSEEIEIFWASLSTFTIFKPLELISALYRFFALLWPRLYETLVWFFPCFAVAWSLAAAVGRTTWLRRYQPDVARRIPTVALLMLLRLSKLAALLALWIAGITLAVRVAVITPASQGQEANLVLCAAMIIVETLLLFMAWSVTNWVIQLAPLVAMAKNVGVVKSIVLAIRAPREVRSRLMEINLVMGIVKVGLLVLAMVLSACPLPFANVETQEYLMFWWVGVVVLWLVMSDYFHVVRTVAYLRLWQALDRTPTAESAS